VLVVGVEKLESVLTMTSCEEVLVAEKVVSTFWIERLERAAGA